MPFLNLNPTSAFALLITLASSAPTTRQAPVYPPTSLSANFRLVANVTSGPLAINNYVLTSYHIGAGEDYAVLTPNTTATSGRIFYVNGTATDVRYDTSNLLSDEGTPLFPAGVAINGANAAGEQTVSINAGEGEAGIGLSRFPDPVPSLYAGAESDFYACDNVLPYGSAIQLLYKGIGDATPDGCSDVTLLPQCSEGSGLDHPFGNTVNCYEDVAGIDWTVYSSD